MIQFKFLEYHSTDGEFNYGFINLITGEGKEVTLSETDASYVVFCVMDAPEVIKSFRDALISLGIAIVTTSGGENFFISQEDLDILKLTHSPTDYGSFALTFFTAKIK